MLAEQLVGELDVAVVSVGELETVGGTLDVVHFVAMESDELVGVHMLLHDESSKVWSYYSFYFGSFVYYKGSQLYRTNLRIVLYNKKGTIISLLAEISKVAGDGQSWRQILVSIYQNLSESDVSIKDSRIPQSQNQRLIFKLFLRQQESCLNDCVTKIQLLVPKILNYRIIQELYSQSQVIPMEIPSLQAHHFNPPPPKSKFADQVTQVFSSLKFLSVSFISGLSIQSVDIDAVLKLYRNLEALSAKTPGQLLSILDGVLQELKGEKQVKTLLQYNPQGLRALCIMMLCPSFYEFENHDCMIRLAHALYFIGDSGKSKLAQWLTKLDTNTLQTMVEALQTFLSVQIHKLLPDSGEDITAIQHYISVLASILDILFRTNCLNPRIERSMFQNPEVTENFDPIVQVKLCMRKKDRLNFTKYSFLLSIEYKQKLLEIESKIEQMSKLEQGIDNINNGILPLHEFEGSLTIDNMLYLHFEISRNNILEDSITKLARTKVSLKKPLKVTFVGQEGHDQGGVKKEYFQLLIKQVFNPHLGMFLPINNYYWFNGDSLEPPINFQLVGVLLGLSIYNSILLELHFPPILYKLLLADATSLKTINYLEELKDLYPDNYKSLKHILDAEDLTGLDLFFQVESESFGVKHYHDLVQNGFSKPVTQENKKEYCNLYAEWLLVKHVAKQFTAFRRGFYKVVSGVMIKTIFPDELEKIICGEEELDFKALESTADYEGGYTKDSRVVKDLWEILHSMDLEDKKKFLFFTTGSDRSPLKGLGELQLVVQRQGPDCENLPTAHTCTNFLLLPEYSNKEKLRQKLQLALKNNQGFGLI